MLVCYDWIVVLLKQKCHVYFSLHPPPPPHSTPLPPTPCPGSQITEYDYLFTVDWERKVYFFAFFFFFPFNCLLLQYMMTGSLAVEIQRFTFLSILLCWCVMTGSQFYCDRNVTFIFPSSPPHSTPSLPPTPCPGSQITEYDYLFTVDWERKVYFFPF